MFGLKKSVKILDISAISCLKRRTSFFSLEKLTFIFLRLTIWSHSNGCVKPLNLTFGDKIRIFKALTWYVLMFFDIENPNPGTCVRTYKENQWVILYKLANVLSDTTANCCLWICYKSSWPGQNRIVLFIILIKILFHDIKHEIYKNIVKCQKLGTFIWIDCWEIGKN